MTGSIATLIDALDNARNPYLCACCCNSNKTDTGTAPMAKPSPRDKEVLPVVTYPMIDVWGGAGSGG